jgi:hypothetical protein
VWSKMRSLLVKKMFPEISRLRNCLLLALIGVVTFIKIYIPSNVESGQIIATFAQQKISSEPCQQQRNTMPEKLIICYADHYSDGGVCDIRVYNAAVQGCNVIIWFSINIGFDTSSNSTTISGTSQDFDCVASTASKLREENISTIHLISIGNKF